MLLELASDEAEGSRGDLAALCTSSTKVKLAIRALENHPVRSRPAMLANPLDQSAIRLEHLERVRTSIGHRDG